MINQDFSNKSQLELVYSEIDGLEEEYKWMQEVKKTKDKKRYILYCYCYTWQKKIYKRWKA